MLYKLSTGDELYRENKALIVRFAGKRDALSTAAYNGGFQSSLKWVFNHDCKLDGQKDTPLKAPTYAEHMCMVASDLGLDPTFTCGLSTAADMDNVSIQTASFDDLTVTAIVTGGIDCNGGRVGDPADWHELNGESVPIDKLTPSGTTTNPLSGTINIMLFIDAQLPPGTLTRALVTCTEAKTAALQELLAPSLYSSGIATGSGTDGTIIVSNAASPLVLTFAGKHSKLGELIGHTVMKAVKESLYLQTGLSATQQFDIFSRISRYGITRELIETAVPHHSQTLDVLSKRRDLVVLTSLYVHLLDQLQWGLITGDDAFYGAARILRAMVSDYNLMSGSPVTIDVLCTGFCDAMTTLCSKLS